MKRLDRRQLLISSTLGFISIPFGNLLGAPESVNKTSFDYIVVGAGSAGCILASQLAQLQPEASVLLIEAGSQVSSVEDVVWDPRKAVLVRSSEKYLWSYKSEPQKNLNGRIIDLVRGKGMGGTTIVNGMVYARGSKSVYDNWSMMGCKGWDFESVLPHFLELERTMVPQKSTGNPFLDSVVEACGQLGVPYSENYLEQENPYGVGPFYYNRRNGRRETSFSGAIQDRELSNLYLLPNALVHKLVLGKGKVHGVSYSKEDGKTLMMHSREEVILSSGAFGSPHLLMLSGIGDKEHLRSVGIQTELHLPGVGQNLQDHVSIPIIFKANSQMPREPYGTVGPVIFGSNRDDPKEETGLESFLIAGDFHSADTNSAAGEVFALVGSVLATESRGQIRLKSNRARDLPLVDPNYLASQRDINRCRESLAFLRELGHSSSFDSWRKAEIYPGPDVKSHDEVHEFLRGAAGTSYHYSSTCKMGIDDEAVVDPQCRVYGIDGLRVVDGSIMPYTVNANTSAAIMMMAHRAAQLISENRLSS